MSSRGEQGNGETTIVGARLRQLREEAGLSLTALATRVPYSRAALDGRRSEARRRHAR